MSYCLHVPGPPRPSGRPRFARVGKGIRTYPDPKDDAAKVAVSTAWFAAGRPRVDGIWVASVEAVVPRPKSHWCRKGLSAAGRRMVAPPGDVDNFAKLPLDVLVKAGAVSDDRYCLRLVVVKRWAERDSPGELVVVVTSYEGTSL